MHKRDRDECVHAAAAQHNTPCEHEAAAESVNEEGGRSRKIDGLKMRVCVLSRPKLDEDCSSPQESESAQKSEEITFQRHTPKRAAAFYL